MSYIFNYIDFYNYYINPSNKKKRHAKKGTTTIQKLMGI